jgi:glycerol kinase
MAYQVHDVVRAVHSVSGFPLASLKVDGGATENDFVMQFQSDISNIPVLRPTVTAATARGAAFLAGLATGVWKDRAELADSFELERQFEPKMSRADAEKLYAGWQKATERALDWAEHED